MTGGTGLFGHWILDSLSDANRRLNLKIEATVLTRNPANAIARMPSLDRHIKFIQGNVENFTFPSEKYDFIFHMATTNAKETFDGALQSQKIKTLYEGTQRVIEFAEFSKIKRILFTSSGAIYGNQNCNGIKETSMICVDSLQVDSGLTLGKGVAEFLLKQANIEKNQDIVIARCFSFIGPGIPLNLHYAIGNFIKNSLEDKPIVIKGDGTAIRSYMYMGDLVWWLIKILLDGQSGDAYNVGSDEQVSILELAKRVKKAGESGGKIIITGIENYSVGIPARSIYTPDIGKARGELQLEINVKIESSIKETIKFIKNNYL